MAICSVVHHGIRLVLSLRRATFYDSLALELLTAAACDHGLWWPMAHLRLSCRVCDCEYWFPCVLPPERGFLLWAWLM